MPSEPAPVVTAPGRSPLLTFVIPVYNRAALLPRAVHSVTGHYDGDDIEIVLIDDGSTDDSRVVMAALADSDPRVRVVYNARNLGLGPTRNHGFDEARGRWVVLLDSDNAIEPGGVARIRAVLAEHGDDVVACWFGSRDTHGRPTVSHGTTAVVPGHAFSDLRFPGEHLGVIRADVARAVRYPSLGTKGECPPCFWYGVADRGSVFVTNEIIHFYETGGTDRLCAPAQAVRRAGELAACYELVAERYAVTRPALSAHMRAKALFYRTVEGKRPPIDVAALLRTLQIGGVRTTLPYVALGLAGEAVATWALVRRMQSA
jgi:hypothetical protein